MKYTLEIKDETGNVVYDDEADGKTLQKAQRMFADALNNAN